MRVRWTILVLLGLTLSRASQSQNTSTCSDKLPIICEPSRADVRVPCPNVTAEVVTFKLFKGQKKISTVKCDFNQSEKCSSSHRLDLHIREAPFSVSFVLNDSSLGTYRCEAQLLFPPPFRTVPSEARVAVVEGRLCINNKPESELVWIWIMVVSLLIIYSVTVTIATFVIWIKLRKADSQSDYMNTKPRAPRDRKKRGVRNPIPRYI